MSEKFTVVTVGLIYNTAGDFLITKRSLEEQTYPGLYSFPGGKLKYQTVEFASLEKNVIREVMEETNIEIEIIDYLQSYSFSKENGDKVVVMAFLAKYLSGDLAIQNINEITEVSWKSINEIEKLSSLENIKKLYRSAAQKLAGEIKGISQLHVAGLVINSKNEFLLIKNGSEFTFPQTVVTLINDDLWEALEKNLRLKILSETQIEIADGMIPFTDEAFIGKNGFQNIIQFYICKVATEQENQESENFIWKDFADFPKEQMKELDYQVFMKARKFIEELK
ncbi:MAG: NUDIX hydrolase [bacterium]